MEISIELNNQEGIVKCGDCMYKGKNVYNGHVLWFPCKLFQDRRICGIDDSCDAGTTGTKSNKNRGDSNGRGNFLSYTTWSWLMH